MPAPLCMCALVFVSVCVCVSHRFFYATGPWHRRALPQIYAGNRRTSPPELFKHHVFAPLTKFPVMNDALHTIIQWLYGKLQSRQKEQNLNR